MLAQRHQWTLRISGGGWQRVELNQLTDLSVATNDDILGIDAAVDRLAREYSVAAELVTHCFFAGMTLRAAADTLGLSDRSADRY